MAAQKVYQIQINGLTESVKAVDALNESLKTLEARIKALEGKTVSVGSKSSGGSSKSSSLSEEEKLQKQIEQLEEKRIAHSKEIYQNYLAAKDVLKETEQDQKQIAAAERVAANSYSNTIQGMKQELADIKAVMQTVDLGDTEQLDKMVKRANELNTELKKVEESYGQFGRNVGNYKSAADGFKGLRFEIAGAVQEFDNAKQALKTLQGELRTLQVKKDQGMLLSEEELKRFQELPTVVAQLKSSIQDAGKPMDALMDTMQSLVAIAQVSKGFSAFFGFDNDAIERSIQKLVALQNAMQGLQKINEQIKSGEFMGGWLSKASSAIDAFAAKITKTDKAAKALSLSLKGLTGIALIGVIVAMTKALSDLNKKQKDVEKATEEGVKAYGKAEVEISVLQTKLDKFNGTKEQEKELVESLNSKYGNSLGQYKSLAEWKDALVKKGKAYCQILQKEAEMQAIMNMYTENFIKLQKARKAQEEGNQDTVDLILKALDGEVSIRRVLASIRDDFKAPFTDNLNEYNDELQKEIDRLEENGKELKEQAEKIQTEISEISSEYEVMDNAPHIEKNGKKTEKAVEKVQNEITKKEIDAMEDGLNKKLRQLDEEERQTINKIKKNGRNVGDEILKVQRAYAALRIKEIKEYLSKLEETISKSASDIQKIQFSLDISKIDNQINGLQNKFEELSENVPLNNELLTNVEFQNLVETKGLEKASRDINAFVYEQNTQLDNFFRNRYEAARKFYEDTIKLLKDNIKQQSELEEKRIKEQEKQEREAEGERYSNQMSALTKTKKDVEDGLKAIVDRYGEITKEGAVVVEQSNKKISQETLESYRNLEGQLQEINAQIEKAKEQHKYKLEEITKEANNAIKKNEIDTINEIRAAQERYYSQQLSNYRDFQSKMNDEHSRNPVIDKNWGIVNLSQSKKNYKEILNASKEALMQLEADKQQLEEDYKGGLIGKDSYNVTKRQLNDLEKEFKLTAEYVTEDLEILGAEWWGSINMWIQQAGQALTSILGSISEITSNQYDKEIEQQEEYISKYEEMLDKQRDITQQYASEIDSIEDELATSRGDRRQHLIDQLNAEIEARRASAEEEKRLDRERQKAEDKKKKLEHDQAVAKKKMDLAQAAINAAMAISMAAVNHWPIPAVPMMAMAASVGAAQIAAIASQNIPSYAVGGQLEGGIAQGNRHRDGGIKVLGGRAEIEGGEFITNRVSTQMNAPLLEFINSKKKKIDVSDLLEFYSSGSVKKNIMKMSPKSKFADGGYIPPTLSTTIEIEDKLLDSFERYSNRPVVVSVVDITSKQDDVRRVQTLAGL
jgi:chromosome segregation ATPase